MALVPLIKMCGINIHYVGVILQKGNYQSSRDVGGFQKVVGYSRLKKN